MATSSASVSLASFQSQARGIKFYGVPTTHVYVGLPFACRLDAFNPFDANAISLTVGSHLVLGHLAREAAFYLAPLLRHHCPTPGKGAPTAMEGECVLFKS
jgi:hypothetical protein